MDQTHEEIIKRSPLAEAIAAEGGPIRGIRTETVLSRLPIHNLAKRGRVNIQIVKRNADGAVTLHWEVSYSDRYGQARAAAYKLDTLVVNRRLDEQGRPLPKMICLGSLRGIAEELGLGGDTNIVRRALRQNAFAAITAKLTYPCSDGSERRLEADFTRYSVIFTGEKLPDGRRADAVYIILNEPYREVLNYAPVRPLNYEYLRVLPPAAQRFYEIVSYRMFATLKKRGSEAIMPYSDYCTFSAQQRYFDYDHFKKQMYKVHRLHIQSGYLSAIRYVAATDADGRPDWKIHYTPGPRAEAEFHAFAGGRSAQQDLFSINQEIALAVGEWTPEPKSRRRTAPTTETKDAATKALVAYFHSRVRGVEGYRPPSGSKETSQADDLIRNYGEEGARFIVDYGAAEAEKTQFRMRFFGGLLQYVPDAAAALERRQTAAARAGERERADAGREEAELRYAEGRKLLAGLTPEARLALYSEVRKDYLSRWPNAAPGAGRFLERMIESAMIRRLLDASGGS